MSWDADLPAQSHICTLFSWGDAGRGCTLWVVGWRIKSMQGLETKPHRVSCFMHPWHLLSIISWLEMKLALE